MGYLLFYEKKILNVCRGEMGRFRIDIELLEFIEGLMWLEIDVK